MLWKSYLKILPQSDIKAFRQQKAWICYPYATELLKSVENCLPGYSGNPQSIGNLETGDKTSKKGFDVEKSVVFLCFCYGWCWKHYTHAHTFSDNAEMTQAYLGGKLNLLKVAGIAGGVTWGRPFNSSLVWSDGSSLFCSTFCLFFCQLTSVMTAGNNHL